MPDTGNNEPAPTRVGDALLRYSGMGSRLSKREADLAALDQLDGALIDTLGREFHDTGDRLGPGFDPSALRTGDPRFSAETFLIIARDTFRIVQTARSQNQPSLAADAVDPAAAPALLATLAPTVDTPGDVAALDIVSAELLAAGRTVDGDLATVRFLLSGAVPQAEDWTFRRDPSSDSAALDEQHLVQDPDGWTVPHRGWRLTAITPTTAPLSAPPQSPSA